MAAIYRYAHILAVSDQSDLILFDLLRIVGLYRLSSDIAVFP